MIDGVTALSAAKTAGSVPYLLRFGELPKIVYPELVRRNVALVGSNVSGPTSFSASRGGERIVFIDRSLSEEERVKKEKSGFYHYDLFMIENGIKRQMTNLGTYMSFDAISYDGSTAGFGTYAKPISEFRYEPARDRPFELSIVDLRTGVVTPTDLIARVNADPRFAVKGK